MEGKQLLTPEQDDYNKKKVAEFVAIHPAYNSIAMNEYENLTNRAKVNLFELMHNRGIETPQAFAAVKHVPGKPASGKGPESRRNPHHGTYPVDAEGKKKG